MRLHTLLIALFVTTAAAVFADDPKPEAKKNSKPPLKEQRRFDWSGCVNYEGVVTEIDKDTLTIDVKGGAGPGRKGTYKFHALDLHKAGEVPETATEYGCYRWQDVKVGDTILVGVGKDKESSVLTPYVIELCIRRRPGDKLPESQKPKEDKKRWQKDSLLNDIANGKDVADEEIDKLFPPHRNSATGQIDFPGGIPQESREQLAALREKLAAEKAKKEKDLKATPPEKK